jgi:hypothetical protein
MMGATWAPLIGVERPIEDWQWEKLFAWLPRQLASTGKWVWLTEVYLGVREVHGPDEAVILHKYLTPEEFTWEMLVQNA